MDPDVFSFHASTNLLIVFTAASFVYEQQQTVTTQWKSCRQFSFKQKQTNSTPDTQQNYFCRHFDYTDIYITEVRQTEWLR